MVGAGRLHCFWNRINLHGEGVFIKRWRFSFFSRLLVWRLSHLYLSSYSTPHSTPAYAWVGFGTHIYWIGFTVGRFGRTFGAGMRG
ncbi:hypothetical protein T440DRAFT_141650 [Plenodomus tracheiphilus IPT5]|uniref:Uncharacterized protein n=1 Tax=Plenodomus tracheiphilus IPT5 TaxID=1408161 RepID=A0A6A7B1B9_9PLEO|nr:hypothetical protein T440DRAFT_141650 [Plenodomus tracheiphilus IPT5]